MQQISIRQVHRAIRERKFDEVIEMIQSSDRIRSDIGLLGGSDWLQYAAYYGYDELAEKLLAIGFDPNARAEQVGDQALAFAASQGHVSTMRILLRAGAALDTSESVRSPVIAAITGGHEDAVRLLIEAGIDLFAGYGEDKKGTALVHALERGETKIAALIAEAMSARSGRSAESLFEETKPHRRKLRLRQILPKQGDDTTE